MTEAPATVSTSVAATVSTPASEKPDGVEAAREEVVVLDYGVVVKTDGYHPNPAAVGTTAPFADPTLVRTGPNAYSVHMLAHLWAYTPSPLHVPQGAAITFYLTSADVVHGFQVQGTTINMTAVPGIIGYVTYSFAHAGTYNIICNEFCGIEHQSMIGRIIVDPEKRT